MTCAATEPAAPQSSMANRSTRKAGIEPSEHRSPHRVNRTTLIHASTFPGCIGNCARCTVAIALQV
jgi:hypothetical protein